MKKLRICLTKEAYSEVTTYEFEGNCFAVIRGTYMDVLNIDTNEKVGMFEISNYWDVSIYNY